LKARRLYYSFHSLLGEIFLFLEETNKARLAKSEPEKGIRYGCFRAFLSDIRSKKRGEWRFFDRKSGFFPEEQESFKGQAALIMFVPGEEAVNSNTGNILRDYPDYTGIKTRLFRLTALLSRNDTGSIVKVQVKPKTGSGRDVKKSLTW
jgi:hypothetical protein